MSWNKTTVALMAALVVWGTARNGRAQLLRKARPRATHQRVVYLTGQASPQSVVVSGSTCPHCYGNSAVASCRQGCFVPVVTPVVSWALNPNAYILSPDHGWSYVIKRPIHRKNITYQRYWPVGWDGKVEKNAQPAQRYPVIAQPTDTMQMGYYYQHVPTWRPRPGMLPRPPVPSQWHVRKCSPRPDNTYVVWVPLSQMPQGSGAAEPQQPQPQQPAPQPLPQQQVPPAPQPPKASAPATTNTASHLVAPTPLR